jgi:hypothetical protein
MTCYQLACWHWQSERESERYSLGGHMPCDSCGLLRVLIIGYAEPPRLVSAIAGIGGAM